MRIFADRKVFTALLVATVITAVIGFLGKDYFESAFSSVTATAVELIITGFILLVASRFMHGKKKEPDLVDGVVLGIAQSISIIPGISRSGATIASLLFRGLDAQKAFVLAFLAGIPAILGAAVLEAKEISAAFCGQKYDLLAGFLASFLTGLVALFLLRIVLKKAKLHYFGYYCILAGSLALFFLR
jgi:undecaprenyl-diphosphatase